MGWAANGPDSGRACLFDMTGNGVNVDLGTLGGSNSEARYINNNGQIVGYAENNLGNQRACLFDPTGQGNNIDLNSFIDSSSGWTLEIAYSINNNGWIVGVGINPEGYFHAYLLIIPEPAIEATVDIDPDTLNLQSNGKWITCYISLPADYNVVDINSASVVLNDTIKAEWTWAEEEEQVMMAKFNRSAVQDILQPGQIELTVSGKLLNGRRFEGKDTITVINKGKQQ